MTKFQIANEFFFKLRKVKDFNISSIKISIKQTMKLLTRQTNELWPLKLCFKVQDSTAVQYNTIEMEHKIVKMRTKWIMMTYVVYRQWVYEISIHIIIYVRLSLYLCSPNVTELLWGQRTRYHKRTHRTIVTSPISAASTHMYCWYTFSISHCNEMD